MEADDIKPQDARRLRAAFKKTRGKELPEDHKLLLCDFADVRWDRAADRYCLCLQKDGRMVAQVPITKRDLKRFKLEILVWNDTRSGAGPAYFVRHG